ncbi:hypothetical protein [Actinorugispora endophytica]|uniref:Ribbon-helix-helix CopG family protein n=1 Tax=Actinorugispora endophytica TaxID=1605990 RepID=A0A4R6UJ68_9ACTN|nr:hypothetical protein [Actinorugispora endophytica]TDQ46871.1 hypothetical protein EV190_12325 [Actinorugispora endophytica]
MASHKVSVTLPEELLEASKTTARARGVSLSALITEALESLRRSEEGRAAVREFEAEAGEITVSERARARAVLAGADARKLMREAESA